MLATASEKWDTVQVKWGPQPEGITGSDHIETKWGKEPATEIGTFERKEQRERHRCLRVALVARSCISTGAVSYKTFLIGLSKIGEPHRVRALWPTR